LREGDLGLLAVEVGGRLKKRRARMKSFWFETLLRKRSAACQRWASRRARVRAWGSVVATRPS
jgi:hypothetical protein